MQPDESEGKIFIHKLLHSAVDSCKLLYSICLFVLCTDSTDSHKSAFLLTKLVVTGEVVIEKEAGVSYKAVFTDKTELGADCINCYGVEISDSGNKCCSFVFGRENNCGADKSVAV